jgi:hypothetical protein
MTTAPASPAGAAPPVPPDSTLLAEILAGDALSLGAVGRLLPARSGKGRVCPSTVWRWAHHGTRTPDGRLVRLEVARVGERWLTSRAAVERYIQALTVLPAEAPTRTPAARRTASERAAARLRAAGA